ncbi:hypothetical protein [Terasakiella sp.]|uniref:hypothetical protein n=1 Tax=Terasakiella sp. TaxID=2034861 RepID=UPI003AA9A041
MVQKNKNNPHKKKLDELQQQLKTLPKDLEKHVQYASSTLLKLNQIQDLKAEYQEQLVAIRSGSVSARSENKNATIVNAAPQPPKPKPAQRTKLHDDDLQGKTEAEMWEIYDRFLRLYDDRRGSGEITDGSWRQYRNKAKVLMLKHGLDPTKRY